MEDNFGLVNKIIHTFTFSFLCFPDFLEPSGFFSPYLYNLYNCFASKFVNLDTKYQRLLLHSAFLSGSGYTSKQISIWAPICARHALVFATCSVSESVWSGLSRALSAFFTGLIFSLHCKRKAYTILENRTKLDLEYTVGLYFLYHSYLFKDWGIQVA